MPSNSPSKVTSWNRRTRTSSPVVPRRQLGHASGRRRRPSPVPQVEERPRVPARPAAGVQDPPARRDQRQERLVQGRTSTPRVLRANSLGVRVVVGDVGSGQKAGSCSCLGLQSWISSSFETVGTSPGGTPAQRLGGPGLGDQRLAERVVAVDQELVPPVQPLEVASARAGGRTCRPRPGCSAGQASTRFQTPSASSPEPVPLQDVREEVVHVGDPERPRPRRRCRRSSRSTCPSGSRSGRPGSR